MGLFVNEDDFTLEKLIKKDPDGFCTVHRGKLRKKQVGVKVMHIIREGDLADLIHSIRTRTEDVTFRDTDMMTRCLPFQRAVFSVQALE